MKILCGIVVMRKISVAGVGVSLNDVDWSGFSISFERILLEEKLEANEMLAE